MFVRVYLTAGNVPADVVTNCHNFVCCTVGCIRLKCFCLHRNRNCEQGCNKGILKCLATAYFEYK